MRSFMNLSRLRRGLSVESMEHRVMFDAALGDAFEQFSGESELKSELIEQAVSQYQGTFGQVVEGWWGWGPGCFECRFFDTVALPAPGAADTAGAAGNGSAFSTTNTQVAGVDEGDIVETDGEYVYVLSTSQTPNQVTIIDIRTPAHPRVAARVELEPDTYANEMYLDGDRLTVVSTKYNYGIGIGRPVGGVAVDMAVDIAMPFGGRFWNPGEPTVVVTVVDVADREAPWIVKTTEIDGSLTSSRALDGNAYIVVQDWLNFPQPLMNPITPTSGNDLPQYQYETEADYRARIEPLVLDVLPNYTSYNRDGRMAKTGLVSAAEEIYHTDGALAGSSVSIVTIDMHVDEVDLKSSTTVMATSGEKIYMSLDSLYLFQPTWDDAEQTEIVKFAIDAEEGTVDPVAIGTVPGRMLNQFSADEMHHQLRVATTSGWGRESQNALYVLDENDENELEIVGSVEGMAPGESIMAVRFVNYTGYVVTFERVDPLFTIDLTDATNPTISSELKINGFSQQLVPIDDHHLLGIGRDADPKTGQTLGIQVSLFDVSDPNNAVVVDLFTMDSDLYMWSPAEWDHHAIGYYPEYQTLALPVSQYQSFDQWTTDESGQLVYVPMEVNYGMHIFHIDVDAGIDQIGTIEHPDEALRSLRIDDVLVTISQGTLKLTDIHNPKGLIGQLHFLPPPPRGGIPVEPLTSNDIDSVFQGIAIGSDEKRLDFDGNSVVNGDDVAFVVEAVFRTDYGDTNLDGRVDFTDFLTLSANFGVKGGWAEGDFDGDGLVGFSDFTLLSQNFAGPDQV